MPEVIPVLVARLKEREENVKMDVFATFTDLLQQVALTFRLPDADVAASRKDVPSALLGERVPDIVRAVCRQLKEKSLKVRCRSKC